MKKRIFSLLIALVMIVGLLPTGLLVQPAEASIYEWLPGDLGGYISDPNRHQGSFEHFMYNSAIFDGDPAPVEATVYVPYGYYDNERAGYNIMVVIPGDIYPSRRLMETKWSMNGWDVSSGDVYDYLIETGRIQPVLVVCLGLEYYSTAMEWNWNRAVAQDVNTVYDYVANNYRSLVSMTDDPNCYCSAISAVSGYSRGGIFIENGPIWPGTFDYSGYCDADSSNIYQGTNGYAYQSGERWHTQEGYMIMQMSLMTEAFQNCECAMGIPFSIQKFSADPDKTNGNTCYSLENAGYTVYGSYDDAVAGVNPLETMYTNANGIATTEGKYNTGTYYVKETYAPMGYALDTEIHAVIVTSDLQVEGDYVYYDTPLDDPARFSIYKNSDRSKLITSSDAVFRVDFFGNDSWSGEPARTWYYRTSGGVVWLDDPDYLDYERENAPLYTSTSGYATYPLGTIRISEEQAPAGYHTAMDEMYASVTEGEDGNAHFRWLSPTQNAISYTPEGEIVLENVIKRGKLMLQKYDTMTGTNAPIGAGTLAGAEFQIINAQDDTIDVYGVDYAPGEVIMTIVTDDTGYAETEKVLPYGQYIVKEVNAPAGYEKPSEDDVWMYFVDGEDTIVLNAENYLIRSELRLNKKDGETGNPLANVAFLVTSMTTGESHVLVTDENGRFDSSRLAAAARQYTGEQLAAVIEKVNANDEAVVSGIVDSSLLDPSAYVYFYGSTEAMSVIPAYDRGSLAYDTYMIQELRCDANTSINGTGTSYILMQPMIFEVNDTTAVIDFGTINNYAPPVIKTSLAEAGTGNKDINPTSSVTLTDRVSMTGLILGETYTVKGQLYDKATGSPALGTDGNYIYSDSVTFTVMENNQRNTTVDITFTFNAVDLAGKSYVAFEELYQDDWIVNTHADINDKDQTVTFLNIRTVATVNGIKEANAASNVTLVDTVALKGLTEGMDYILVGELHTSDGEPYMDRYENVYTSRAVVSKDTASPDGITYAEINFNFDATALAGRDVVVYEYLYNDAGKLVGKHADPSDPAQTVHFPYVSTVASYDYVSVKPIEGVNQVQELFDTVHLENLTVGNSYTVKGYWYNKSTGAAEFDGLISGMDFTATAPTMEVVLSWTVDTTKVAGSQLVCFETLYSGGGYILAEHHNPNDENETLYTPDMHTTATGANGERNIPQPEEGVAVIKDTVTYTGLKPGVEYTLKGTLVNAKTGETVLKDGAEYTETLSFVPTTADGTVEMTFQFSAEGTPGNSYVVFEDLYTANIVTGRRENLIQHHDITDKDQTVTFVGLRTVATVDGLKEANAVTVELVDRIDITGLDTGKKYTVTGELHYTDGSVVLDAKERPITSTVTGVVRDETSPEGITTVYASFNFDASALAGKDVVVYETLLDAKGTTTYFRHADPTDKDQTVKFPAVSTVASYDKNSVKPIEGVTQMQELFDTVHLENLTVGNQYTVKGYWYNKTTGAAEFDGLISEAEFTATSPTMEVVLSWTVDTTKTAGSQLVCFESLYSSGGYLLAEHHNPNDEDETLYTPDMRTTATGADGEKNIPQPEDGIAVIKDTVTYTGLKPGIEYTLKGSLVNARTGETVLKDDAEYVETVTFTPSNADGTAEMIFSFPADATPGNSYVVFEDLYMANVVTGEPENLIEHHDITDKDQTVTFIGLKTVANVEGLKEANASMVELIDRIDITGLEAGRTYTVTGELHYTDGSAVTDENGIPVKSTVTNVYNDDTAENGITTVYASFTFDAKNCAGKDVVVFETLYDADTTKQLFRHADTEDKDQTVKFIELSTTASYDENEVVKIQKPSEDTTIYDVVTLKNLTPGNSYTVSGYWVDKSTGEKVFTDANTGETVTAETTFTATAAEMDVVMTWTVDTITTAGTQIVCFETLTNPEKGVILGEHHDTEDEKQNLYSPDMSTTAKGINGSKEIEASKEVVLQDIIEYKGLQPSVEYTIRGKVVNQTTGEFIKDEAGNVYEVTHKFIPEKAEGTVTVNFRFDGSELGNQTYVVFENLYIENDVSGESTLIVKHEDIGDKAQAFDLIWHHLTKVDASSLKPLAGVTIRITDKTDSLIRDVVADEEGRAWFALIPGHSYNYQELDCPKGYIIDTSVYAFTVNEDGVPDNDLIVRNITPSTVLIQKRDAVTAHPVAGAEITIKDSNGNVVQKQVTDKLGYIYFDTAPYAGQKVSFTYAETKAPDGYQINLDTFEFSIDELGRATGTFEILDCPNGAVAIRKTDTNGKPLEGAKISIYTRNGALVGQATTGKTGRVYFVPPFFGEFYYVEDEAPAGYVRDSSKHYFTVVETGKVTGSLSFTNSRTPSGPVGNGSAKTGDNTIFFAIGTVACLVVTGSSLAIAKRNRKKSKK